MKRDPARRAPTWRIPMLALLFTAALGAGCSPESGTNGGSGGRGGSGSGGNGGSGSGGSGGSTATGGSGGSNGGTGGSGSGTGGSTGGSGSGGSTGGSGGTGSGGSGGSGSGGSTGGSGGSGSGGSGTGGTGGSTDGGRADGRPADTSSAPADMNMGASYPPLTPCAKPSVDHLEVWRAHGGSLRPPAGGTILTQEAGKTIAKVDFLPGSAYHEVVVPVMNDQTKKVDLTMSAGITITYSATADLHVQLRPLSFAHGGEQWTAKLPSTGGMTKDLFVPFTTPTWGDLLGPPPFPFSQALRDANFFNFVGSPGVANSITVRGLRFDKHVPPCS